MTAANNKISIRQTTIIFLMSTMSAVIRLLPTECVKTGGRAAWLAPVISALPLLILFNMLASMFKKDNVRNFGDVIELSFGKIAGKILLAFYLIWSIILYLLYTRYYAERLLSSIFPDSDMTIFILVMMLLVFMVSRGRIEVFARFNELFFLVMTVIILVFFVLLLPSVKLENLYPVTYYDIIPAVKATYPVLAIWGYIPLLLFFGEYVVNKKQLNIIGKKAVIFLMIMNTLLLLTIIGSLGYKVVQRMPLPFFSVVKAISFIEVLNRLESILLSVWVISDFIVINVFALIIMHIMKQLFAVSEIKYFAAPIALLGYSGGLFFSPNRPELSVFSSNIGLPGNIIATFIIPVIIFLVGKFRKKI